MNSRNVSPSEILRSYLIGTGLVALPSSFAGLPRTEKLPEAPWPISVNEMPIDGDYYVSVHDYNASLMDGRMMRSGERVVHPSVQVRVRARDFAGGFGFAISVRDILDRIKRSRTDIDGRSYVIDNAMRTTDIIPLGEEPERHRQLFTINMRLTIPSYNGFIKIPTLDFSKEGDSQYLPGIL